MAHVVDTSQESPCIENIPIVNEFQNVFSDKLSGMSPDENHYFGDKDVAGDKSWGSDNGTEMERGRDDKCMYQHIVMWKTNMKMKKWSKNGGREVSIDSRGR